MLSSVTLSIVLAAAPVGADTPTTRFDIVLYDPPAGWKREDKDGKRVYTTSDDAFTVVLTPSVPFQGKIDAFVDELKASAEKKEGFREEAARQGGKHDGTGGEWMAIAYSYNHPYESGKYNYEWVATIAAGDRCVTAIATANTSKAFNDNAPIVGKMITGLKMTTTLALEAGDPPLTRFMVDETTDFLEWLVNSPLTEGQRSMVEAELRKSWKEGKTSDIHDLQELLEGRKQLAAMKTEARDVARQAVLEEAIKGWKEDKESPSAKMMLGIYEAANQPIAAGPPPLTRQMVDAFSEFLYFAASETAGIKVTPKDDVKASMAEAVVAQYPKMSAEQRAVIAKMPLARASLVMLWPDMAEAEKKNMIAEWKKSPELLELGKKLQKEADARFVDSVAKLQNQQSTYQAMSNIMMMQHQTNMAIINNMNSGWTYQYRWR
jgi:hypothetical protein